MLKTIKEWLSGPHAHDLKSRLDEIVKQTPLPVFWLFGKTQSGKTSIIRYLTGADDAEIGRGFKPCTRYSREYRFPTAEAPLLTFLDTRGLEEPGYDAHVDLASFDARAHVVVVTARVFDHAVDNTVKQLRVIRARQASRPVILALTCLHEAYPGEQHLEPYPFLPSGDLSPGEYKSPWENLRRAINAQRDQFAGLVDQVVPVDLTPPDEGFTDPHYGGPRLKEVLIGALPEAYRQTLLTLDRATGTLRDYFEKMALPYILAFSSLAGTAGAIPIPWLDLVILPSIQTRMIYKLANLYGQPLTGQRFVEFAGTLGLGMLVRQGIRELAKLMPIVGSVAGAALAASSTFALGKAFCYYYGSVLQGHVPRAADLKAYYREQLIQAEMLWRKPGVS